MQLPLAPLVSRRLRTTPLRLSIASLLLAASPLSVRAAEFTWDANPASPSVIADDGSGTWDTANNNWISGGVNTPWVNDPTNDAIFGAGTDAAGSYLIDVNMGGLGIVDSLAFNNSGYVLTSPDLHTITLSNATAAISIAPGKTATIGANVTLTSPAMNQNSAVTGGGTLVLENGGTLINGGSVSSNVLNINGTTVELRAGGSLQTSPINAIFVQGTLNVVGGAVNAVGTLGIGQNSAGAGTLTIGSGTVTALSTNGVRFGSNAGTTPGGTLNLNGGVLTALKLAKGTGTVTTSVVNLNGGVLKAAAAAPVAFFTGLQTANVRNGGAIIDSSGRSITIAQPLLHSTISGDAATDGGLTKLGAGTLTLTGANTYNGGTIIDGGTLQFDGGALPQTGGITINAGGALAATGAFSTVAEVLSSGRLAAGSTGAIALAGDSGEDINLAGYAGLRLGASINSTYFGVLTPAGDTYRLGGGGAALKIGNENTLTGARNLSVSGLGTVIIASNNNYSGTTTIESGTLQLGDGFTSGTLGTTTSVANGGTIAFNPAGIQTFDLPITGVGSLAKLGTGTLILSGNNSFTGTSALSGGDLQLAHANALGTSSVSSNLGTVQLQLSGGIVVSNTIRVSGSGRNLDGILKNVSGSNTLTDFGFFMTGGTRIHVEAGSTLNLPNSIALAPTATAQSFRVLGTGTLVVGGDNTFAINSAGSFLLGNGSAPGPIVAIGNDLGFGAGAIDFQAASASTLRSTDTTVRTIANPLKFSDASLNLVTFGAAGSGDLIFTGPANLIGNLEVTVLNTSTALAGAITGSAALTKAGAGTLVLSGLDANSYTGGTTVSSGVLNVQKDDGLGLGDVSVLNAATLKLELGTSNDYISDTGRLLLAAGSPVVNLAFTGAPDSIAGLSFDGGNTFAAAGTWGSLTSGATFTSPVFTGTGTLSVIPEPATALTLLSGVVLLSLRRRRAA